MTVGELKKQLANVADEMDVMLLRALATRFHKSEVVESTEIDISKRNGDGGYLRADVFTRSLHRRKVIVIL